jgi:hypothetical protein
VAVLGEVLARVVLGGALLVTHIAQPSQRRESSVVKRITKPITTRTAGTT